MDINKLLNEEINKIKLLSNYNTSNTLSENKSYLLKENEVLEQNLRNLVVGGSKSSPKALKALNKDLKKIMSDIIKNHGGLMSTNDVFLSNAKDIIKGFKNGKFYGTELGKFNWSVFRQTSDNAIINAVAKDIIQTKNFATKYGSKSLKEGTNALMKDYKVTKEKAELLMKEYKSSIKSKPTSKPTFNPKNTKTKQQNHQPQFPVTSGRRKMDTTIYKERANLKNMLNNDKKGLMQWLKNNKLVKGARNVMKVRTLWKLIKWVGGAWLIWKLFFYESEKDGDKVNFDCGPGLTFDYETGNCVDDSGNIVDPNDIDDDDDDDDFEDVNIEDTYVDCTGTYKFGCTDTEGVINNAQRCLGVNPTGKFDKETENALYKKINKTQFTKNDIEDICLSIGDVDYRM